MCPTKGTPTHTAVHRRLSHIRAKDNAHDKSGNHTAKHPLQVFPFKTYLPSTFNVQMCASSRPGSEKKKLFEYRRVAIVQCAAAPGMPSLVYLLPHCVRGAHVNLSNWMQRQTLERQDRQTDTLPPVCGQLRHFF